MAFADGLPKKFLQSQGSFSVDIIRTKVAEGDVYVPYKIVSSNEGNFKNKTWLSPLNLRLPGINSWTALTWAG